MRMGHDSPFPLHSPHHSSINTSDSESRRRLIRLMTACPGEISRDWMPHPA